MTSKAPSWMPHALVGQRCAGGGPRILRGGALCRKRAAAAAAAAADADGRAAEGAVGSEESAEERRLLLSGVAMDVGDVAHSRQPLGVKSEEAVRARLVQHQDCDLVTLSCGVAGCARVFDSALVLAWHMSYAHTDALAVSRFSASCLVCDRQMKTVKGKTSHLMTAHRELSNLHNAQCLLQRQPIAGPGEQQYWTEQEQPAFLVTPSPSAVDDEGAADEPVDAAFCLPSDLHGLPQSYVRRFQTDSTEFIVVDDSC